MVSNSGYSGCQVELWPQAQRKADWVAQERAVALVYNGISHAVMMATPTDLEAFAIGFSLTEGIVEKLSEILDIEIRVLSLGIEVAMTITTEAFFNLKRRRRALLGPTGCGLCGVESLQQVWGKRVEEAPLQRDFQIAHAAIETALEHLESMQPLQEISGAVHGAAWCDVTGRILWVNEDVGRHNALDKLIGEYYRRDYQGQPGFALISSRASFEMVQKCSRAGIAVLVAVSAATSLAVETAQKAGLTLVGFARPNRHVIYSHSDGIKP